MAGLDHAQLFFNVACFIVLVSLILQGSNLAFAARKAQVVVFEMPSPITRLGLEIQLASQWELFIYRLKETRWCIGAELRELNMPENTRIVALFRNNQLLHPSGSTVLETNDILCIV